MDSSRISMLMVVLVIVMVGCTKPVSKSGQQPPPVVQGSPTPEVVDDAKTLTTAADASGTPGGTAIKYPYIATPDRQKQIREGYALIKPDMSQKDVTAVLGQPDDEQPLYEPKIKISKRIGSTYWYLIERNSESLTDAKLVRVAFDLNDRVTGVDHWGFDDTNEDN